MTFKTLRRLKRRAAVLVALLLGVAACASAEPAARGSTLQDGFLFHDGMTRTFHYYIPPQRPRSGPAPLLIALHGGGKAEGDDYAGRNGFVELARKEGFIVVFPNGIEAQWNDGRGVTFRGIEDNTHIDDVGFISAVIDTFVDQHGADAGRVFVEGTSNGGMMTQRIACNLAGKIKGAASVISSMPANIAPTCAPKAKLPMLLMSGTDDPFIPYGGGTVTPFDKPSGEVISTEETAAFWARHNGCRAAPLSRDLPNTSRRDRSTVTLMTYPGCRDAPVKLYRVNKGGHTRPGMSGRVPRRLLGSTNKDINASEEIWRFFESLP